jgi:hypothetical protein
MMIATAYPHVEGSLPLARLYASIHARFIHTLTRQLHSPSLTFTPALNRGPFLIIVQGDLRIKIASFPLARRVIFLSLLFITLKALTPDLILAFLPSISIYSPQIQVMWIEICQVRLGSQNESRYRDLFY